MSTSVGVTCAFTSPFLGFENFSVPRGKKNPAITLCCACTPLCLNLYDPRNHSPPGPSVHGDSPGENIGEGCHFLLQGNLPDPGMEHTSPALPVRFFTLSAIWEAQQLLRYLRQDLKHAASLEARKENRLCISYLELDTVMIQVNFEMVIFLFKKPPTEAC